MILNTYSYKRLSSTSPTGGLDQFNRKQLKNIDNEEYYQFSINCGYNGISNIFFSKLYNNLVKWNLEFASVFMFGNSIIFLKSSINFKSTDQIKQRNFNMRKTL